MGARVEARLRQLEGSNTTINSSFNKNGITTVKKTQSYSPVAAKISAKPSYIDSNDILLHENTEDGIDAENKSVKSEKKKKKKRDKKRKANQINNHENDSKQRKK